MLSEHAHKSYPMPNRLSAVRNLLSLRPWPEILSYIGKQLNGKKNFQIIEKGFHCSLSDVKPFLTVNGPIIMVQVLLINYEEKLKSHESTPDLKLLPSSSSNVRLLFCVVSKSTIWKGSCSISFSTCSVCVCRVTSTSTFRGLFNTTMNTSTWFPPALNRLPRPTIPVRPIGFWTVSCVTSLMLCCIRFYNKLTLVTNVLDARLSPLKWLSDS